MNAIDRNNVSGFSLIEMIITLLIYGVVLTAGIGFIASQNRLFHKGIHGMSALQNVRYVVSTFETDVKTLGTNLPVNQPSLVYAGPNVLAFTGDYASNVANDVFAAFIDLSAPNGQVTAPRVAQVLPNTSFSWPDTLYRTTAGTRSPGELIIYWFAEDSTTLRTDDYALYRKVNNADPETVSRDLMVPSDGAPFFRYFKRTDYPSQAPTIDSIPDGSLPIRHLAMFHASPADTAVSARSDSIRAVRISFRSTNGLSGDDERIAEVTRIIDLPNAGFTVTRTCGDEPILGVDLTATAVDTGEGWAVQLTWPAATDETEGETDVARYVIYRQTTPIVADWGDPYLSIPAGNTTYQYLDASVESGLSYQYAFAAQDCTPSLSSLTTSTTVIVP